MRQMKNILHAISKFDVWTNIFYGFLAVGAYLAGVPFLGAFSCLCLMIGSGVHHHFMERWSAYLDWIPIYMVFGFLAAYNLASPETAPIIWFALVCGASFRDILTEGRNRVINLLAIGLTMLVSVGFSHGYDAFITIAFNFGVAFIPWKIAEDIKSDNHSLYRTYHALWHILTSYAIWKTIILTFNTYQQWKISFPL